MSTFNNAKNVAIVISLGDEKSPRQSHLLKLLECKTTMLSNGQDVLGHSLTGLGKYAYILHEKDLKEDNNPKTPHIHLVLTSDKGASSNTWIKALSEVLDVEKEAISVEPVRSLNSALRYLLHLDNPEKHQYEKEAIHSNMGKALEDALSYHDITLEGLKKCSTASEYLTYVGLDNYSKYRMAWKDLLEESSEMRKTKNLYSSFMQDAMSVVDEMGAYLADKSEFKSKKLEELLMRWQQRLVFGPIDEDNEENN